MNRIIRIGADVHSTNYTLCAMEQKWNEDDLVLAVVEVEPEAENISSFVRKLKEKCSLDAGDSLLVGYEAGCLGYSLHRKLADLGIPCVILAPTTMWTTQGKRVKTDPRDAKQIAECLLYGTYHSVYIPDQLDEGVKEYIRMRDDHRDQLKKLKQQINAIALRHGHHYTRSKWQKSHLKWLEEIELDPFSRETLNEYLITFRYMENRIETLERRIIEMSGIDRYEERVRKLRCFLGIETGAALSLIVETGDFERFSKGNIYASYLGLAPGENSSGESIRRGGISKTGNTHLRTLLIESAQSIGRGRIGFKGKVLKSRQAGNTSEVIAYADRANERLRRKYYRLISRGKPRNVAVAAVARELACFVWGMMTGNMDPAALGQLS